MSPTARYGFASFVLLGVFLLIGCTRGEVPPPGDSDDDAPKVCRPGDPDCALPTTKVGPDVTSTTIEVIQGLRTRKGALGVAGCETGRIQIDRQLVLDDDPRLPGAVAHELGHVAMETHDRDHASNPSCFLYPDVRTHVWAPCPEELKRLRSFSAGRSYVVHLPSAERYPNLVRCTRWSMAMWNMFAGWDVFIEGDGLR